MLENLTNNDLQDIEDHFLLLRQEQEYTSIKEWAGVLDGHLKQDIKMPTSAEGMIMLAEAFNNAAKEIDEDFYLIKPAAIKAAIELGADGGWGSDQVFYLSTVETGVACFHDPLDQIGLEELRWESEWSGVSRQEHAFSILSNKVVRELVAHATHPEGRLYGATDSQVNKWIARLTG